MLFRSKAIAARARANGARSAEEMLYNRLQLPAGSAPVISQRKPPRLRPDKEAVAPKTAAEISENFLQGLKREKSA